jgi:hypothetical protein
MRRNSSTSGAMKSYLLSIFWLLYVNAFAIAGYTHYFTWKIDPADPRLSQCVAAMNKIIASRTNLIDNKPNSTQFIGSDLVHFNGTGTDAYEDFIFPGNTVSQNFDFPHPTGPEIGFNFCKTEYRPYDQVVTACLITARDFFPSSELVIGSDGSWEDWQAGRTLYEATFHREPQNPLVENSLSIAGSAKNVVNKWIGNVLVVVIIAGIVLAQWLRRRQSERRY